jgi:hypothetical protein
MLLLSREILWRRSEYEQLIASREPHHRMAGESSAIYLWGPGGPERIVSAVPGREDRRDPPPTTASRSRGSRTPSPHSPSAVDSGGRSTSSTPTEVGTERSSPGTTARSTPRRPSCSSTTIWSLGYGTKRVCAHLGVSDDVGFDTARRHNVAHGTSRRCRTLDPAERDRLTDSFADDLALLETLTDRDLSHWLAPTGRGL